MLMAFWALQINTALDYIHLQGWGHCDVKPPKIFIDPQGDFYLGDQGRKEDLLIPGSQQG